MAHAGLRFGIFLAPFHRLGDNPTLALARDLDLLVALDQLGFDEAWIGEHHSAGWETIASPELMIANPANAVHTCGGLITKASAPIPSAAKCG